MKCSPTQKINKWPIELNCLVWNWRQTKIWIFHERLNCGDYTADYTIKMNAISVLIHNLHHASISQITIKEKLYEYSCSITFDEFIIKIWLDIRFSAFFFFSEYHHKMSLDKIRTNKYGAHLCAKRFIRKYVYIVCFKWFQFLLQIYVQAKFFGVYFVLCSDYDDLNVYIKTVWYI